ncbi:hypothetical protein KAR91_26270, partial [Candidatus Pacearchaeota archaeon]|nr:hypothetical protein [Candidatus Pacearchaeota archaeon]
MAAISQTPANVGPGEGAIKEQYTAGVGGVVAGNSCYVDPVTNTLLPALGTATTTVGRIIAASTAGAGQPVFGYIKGLIDLGATLVVGTVYAVSAAAAGSIVPMSDLTTGNIVKVLGVADTA